MNSMKDKTFWDSNLWIYFFIKTARWWTGN